MKWLFIVFLLLNVCYLGWELDRQTRIEVSNSVRPFNIPANVQKLTLLKESETASTATIPSAADESNNDNVPQLQNIVSMMDQGNVMIEKKVIDDLLGGLPDLSDNQIEESEPGKILCFSFGPFAELQQAGQLSEWLKNNEIQTVQRTESDNKDQSFWIYLAPSESKNKAMAAIEDLKGKGVQDYKLINKGNLRNAISLGLFSTQSAVNRRLNELKNIGYQPIIVPYHKSQMIIWVDAKIDISADLETNSGIESDSRKNMLSEFINGYPSRFNSIPVKCDVLFN